MKKIILMPALLVSMYAFAQEPQVCGQEIAETRAQVVPIENAKVSQEAANQSEIMQAFALEELLKDTTMKNVYESLDQSQQNRFAAMMSELSMIMDEAAAKTEALMEKNKDIQEVWRMVSKGTTRFVLTAAFETRPEELSLEN